MITIIAIFWAFSVGIALGFALNEVLHRKADKIKAEAKEISVASHGN